MKGRHYLPSPGKGKKESGGTVELFRLLTVTAGTECGRKEWYSAESNFSRSQNFEPYDIKSFVS